MKKCCVLFCLLFTPASEGRFGLNNCGAPYYRRPGVVNTVRSGHADDAEEDTVPDTECRPYVCNDTATGASNLDMHSSYNGHVSTLSHESVSHGHYAHPQLGEDPHISRCEGDEANPDDADDADSAEEADEYVSRQQRAECHYEGGDTNLDAADSAEEADEYVNRQWEADNSTLHGQKDGTVHASLHDTPCPPVPSSNSSFCTADGSESAFEEDISPRTTRSLLTSESSTNVSYNGHLRLTNGTVPDLFLLDLDLSPTCVMQSNQANRTELGLLARDLPPSKNSRGNTHLTMDDDDADSDRSRPLTLSTSKYSKPDEKTSVLPELSRTVTRTTFMKTSFTGIPHGNIFSSRTASVLYYCVVSICILTLLFILREEDVPKTGDAFLLSVVRNFFCEIPTKRENDTKVRLFDPSLGEPPKLAHKNSTRNPKLFDVINEIVLHPWRSWTTEEEEVPCKDKPTKCRWSTDTLCEACQKSVEKNSIPDRRQSAPATGHLSKLARQWSVVVRPLTRFLPDTTNNPALDLAHVGYRLATLSALPPSVPASRVKLADAGFYYRGQGDELICYACQKRHSGWSDEDKPMEVHRRISPDCPHVVQRERELTVRNGNTTEASFSHGAPQSVASQSFVSESRAMVNGHIETPLEDGDVTHSATPAAAVSAASAPPRTAPAESSSARSAPLSGVQETMPHVVSRPREPASSSSTAVSASSSSGVSLPDGRSTQGSAGSAAGDGGALGPGDGARQMFPRAGLDLGGAVYPMYQDMASRRRSFPHWDDRRAPPLDQVILCGMFYAGYADCVRCFYCGVGLKHWEVTDDVWVEHVRWRPSCGYLRAVKGDDYIRRTLAQLGREAAGENEDGPPRHGRGDGDLRPGNNRTNSTAPPRGQQGSGQDRQAPEARPSEDTATRQTPAVMTSTSPASVPSASTTQTTRPGATTTVSASSGSATSSRTTVTSTVPSPSASSTTAAASSPASCDSQNGARPEGGVGSIAPDEESQSQRVARLQAENRELARRLRCKVCLTEPIDTILMPCGHLVVCETCARNVTQCPLCRERIRATAKVHMS